jgi:hypothetical protein
MAKAAHEFPIIFTAEKSGFFPAAMLGTRPDSNVFVNAAGLWLAGYVPANLRRGALRLARVEGQDDWVLCIDLDSDLVNDREGDSLFDQDGAATPFVTNTGQFLINLESARISTERACAALDRQGLLTPWPLSIEQADGSTQTLAGVFRIDEARLNALDGAALGELHEAQALAITYAHLLSLHKLSLLGRLAAERSAEQERRARLEQGKLDLDRAFGIVEDDPFIF